MQSATLPRLAVVASLFLAAAAAANPVPIHWTTCPESWVGSPSGVLGARLQCGTMRAPLDHAAPGTRFVDVGVVRIRAANPSQREGAIFFNSGGPGGHPGKLLRSMAEGWSEVDPDDPDDGDKRRLAERFDMVGVIPRGLIGSEPVRCVTGLPPSHAFLPTHQDDTNWETLREDAQEAVDACTTVPNARLINTEQHVYDMDMLRRALGDERLHFYGISYGGKVGAWYAAMFPGNTGRMLLDSSMDFAHDYRTALHLSLAATQRSFDQDVLAPLLLEPERYGLGSSADDITQAVDDLPALARAAWSAHLDSPARLAAALRLSEWLLDATPPADLNAMSRLIRQARFSPEDALDVRIRWEAIQLSGALYGARPTEPLFGLGPEGDSVRIITACNDAYWMRSEAEMRQTVRHYASRFLSFNGSQILEELTCTRWGGPRARQPDLSPLGRIDPFLLIQSEKDVATPLAGGSFIIERFPNARMLLVRDSKLHGLFNFTTSGCIERTAAHYLLTGELPESPSRVFSCSEAIDHPAETLPGTQRPTTTTPVPIDVPAPQEHDEL